MSPSAARGFVYIHHMNQREAKRTACRWASDLLGRGFGLPEADEFNAEDTKRLQRAWRELIDELFRRGQRGD